jgi:hypothetical protein
MTTNRNKLVNSIKESRRREIAQRREWEIFGSVQLIIKDHPPTNVNIQDIIQELEEKIPRGFVKSLDVIYIGQFEHLQAREVEAIYQDGAIYVSNDQPTEDEFVESIGHEIAHSLEETIPMEIYSDGVIEEEFLGKRRRLWSILKSRNLAKDDDRVYFDQPDYSKNFDAYLYKVVGYPVLTSLTMGLFLSPYAATSLREYFANAFESFFLNGEANYVKQISPAVYNKLIELSN